MRDVPLQRRVWLAMRQLRSFDLGQLITATETKAAYTRPYANALLRAGYFVVRNGRFLIVRDTGPKPPRVLKDYMISNKTALGVEDRNTGERFGIDGGEPPAAPAEKIVPREIRRRPYRRRGEVTR